jgi:Protein of unknown function (DUF1064)
MTRSAHSKHFEELWMSQQIGRRFTPASNLSADVPIVQPFIRAPKFGNVETDGYASKREAKRAQELRLLLAGGIITELREQVQYLLIPAQYEGDKCVERACTYTADFVYRDVKSGALVVEDCKGFPNDRWPIKRKLMRFVHAIAVKES